MLKEKDLSALLREHGWSLYLKRDRQAVFALARKRIDGKLRARYLKAVSKLNELTPEKVLERIRCA